MNNLKNKYNRWNLLLASLIMPAVILPIKYSSLLLLIICLSMILNLILKTNKKERLFLFPFVAYFISIIISFIIDLVYKEVDFDFLLRNTIILIIPLFIFYSNFDKKQIFKIFKHASIIISLSGIVIIFLWISGYYLYNNQQEFQKKSWFKKEIVTSKNQLNKNSVFKFVIPNTSKTPSIRKVITLSEETNKDSITRELIIKTNTSKQDVWILLRNIDTGKKSSAWFNAKTGKIGLIQGKTSVKSEKLANGFFKFELTNKPKINAKKEWFYVSFVSEDGGYRWSAKNNGLVELFLKTPKLYLSSGKNLLKNKSIFNYKISSFNALENYAHSTYLSLVFVFALVILMYNKVVKKWMRYLFIAINVFVVFTLASKAVILSLIILLPAYYFLHSFNFKALIIFFTIGLVLSLNGHIKERMINMYQTMVRVENKEKLGELEKLSTGNRIKIYKNYFSLIKNNYLIGYGNINGKRVVNSSFNHAFNAHNQYLQTLFNSGLLGVILLLLFCFSPFIFRKKTSKNKYGIELFILILLFNFLFESILFRHWGLIIVSFSYAIYFQTFKSELKWLR